MGSTIEPVRVTGLREFQRALRELDGESQKQIRVVMNDALEIVAVDARRKVPRDSGRAVASLKVQSSQREGRLVAGGGKAPYYPWLDFGGRVGRQRSVVRPWKPEGRYIYPSYRRHRDDVLDLMVDGLDRLARDAGLAVPHGR